MWNDLPAYDLSHLTFLIVDSNKHMRTIVRQVLKALGARSVFETKEGAEAYQAMKAMNPDIVMSAMMMDPVNGLELSTMIRTSVDSPNPYVPIIMVSGHTEEHHIYNARDAGVDEFLAKPVSAHTIYSRVVEVIRHRRPFVKSRSYFGPDRRRREDPNYTGARRRITDQDDSDENITILADG
ncbi:Chemotaxis protein CheYIII [Magnetospira sp. QH-2]|nr:Chemotaxis protein CheYIII [Magnetospira sp. QH-2]